MLLLFFPHGKAGKEFRQDLSRALSPEANVRRADKKKKKEMFVNRAHCERDNHILSKLNRWWEAQAEGARRPLGERQRGPLL